MGQKAKQIDCLNKLQNLNGGMSDIFEFLFEEQLLSREQVTFIKSCPDVGKVLQKQLAEFSSANKLQLLEYEWTILPVERIRITIVTERNSREFDFSF